jgi:hypothetical protein
MNLTRVTRSGWFVGIVGGVLLSPVVLLLGFLITAWTYTLVHGPIAW